MRVTALLLSALFAATSFAADIKVENAWVRAPAPGQTVVGGFMDISSARDAKLLSASTPVAGTTELHEMSMKDGVMIMHAVPNIALPQGRVVKLEPGGLHVMLFDLKKQLKQGDKVPLTLKVQTGKALQSIEVQAEVRDPMAGGRH
jgi:hypothetical protein